MSGSLFSEEPVHAQLRKRWPALEPSPAGGSEDYGRIVPGSFSPEPMGELLIRLGYFLAK